MTGGFGGYELRIFLFLFPDDSKAFSRLFMDRRPGKSISRPFEGVGPESLDFFGPKWHSLRSLPFKGPKKSQLSGPTPSNSPQYGFPPIQMHTSRPI
jgi:hypothetical protein